MNPEPEQQKYTTIMKTAESFTNIESQSVWFPIPPNRVYIDAYSSDIVLLLSDVSVCETNRGT